MFYTNLKQFKAVQIFVVYLRYLIGFAWVFSSIVKIQGKRFTMGDGISSPINSAWHMFETLYQSGIYWQFIGWGQLFVGALLLTQRFSLLGAILGLPIASNIFFITISYYFAGTPIITGLMLLGNIFLLFWDWDKLKMLIEPQSYQYIARDNTMIYDKSWMYLGIFYLIGTIIWRVFFMEGKGIVLGGLLFMMVGFTLMFFNVRKYKNFSSSEVLDKV